MRTLLLILLLVLLPVGTSLADAIDLYTGEAVVQGNDAAERKAALPRALAHVLRKLSGLESFEDYPQVEPALAGAASILISFHYRSIESTLADGTQSDQLRLLASFSSDRVDALARELELPLWQQERDPIDVWVVVDNGLDRQIMPVEFAYAWDAMADVARWRGLPVSWPVPDEEGMYLIDPQLLWGGYTEDVGVAPDRGAMIAAVRREGPQWSVRSNLTYHDESWTWRVQDIDLQTALTASMDQAASLVAAANTIAASDLGASVQQLTVAGLGNAEDYRRCLGYLQQLSVVKQVSVVAAQAGSVTFRLELNALPQYLDELLQGGQFLELDEGGQYYVFRP